MQFPDLITGRATPARALVIGVGRSGIAAARVLSRSGWQVVLSDSNHTESLQKISQEISKEGIEVRLNHLPSLEGEEKPSLIVVSPGVPWDIPLLEQAREKNIDVIGEIELAYRNLSHIPWVAITGTNGKTTTTALVEAIFRCAGLNVQACGNIGYAACELILNSSQQLDWVIAEISSYQIESSSKLAPTIGVWTTFTPDHLKRHKTLDKYFEIKASLLERSKHKIFNRDDQNLSDRLGSVEKLHWTSTKSLLDDSGVYLEDNWIKAFGELIMPIDIFKMPGNHNQQNLLMAVAVARLANIEKEAIVKAMSNFSGIAHRLEKICTVDGVDYINDSKATNYDASQVGMEAIDGSFVLIAGGQAKEGDNSAWLKSIRSRATAVLLIGDASELFAEHLKKSGYLNFEKIGDMEKAIPRSLELAKSTGAKNVLLSPACASFDQYSSFEERGEHFRDLSQKLSLSNDILKKG